MGSGTVQERSTAQENSRARCKVINNSAVGPPRRSAAIGPKGAVRPLRIR